MTDYTLHTESSKAKPTDKSSPVHHESQPQAIVRPNSIHHNATVAQDRPSASIQNVDTNDTIIEQGHVDLTRPVKVNLFSGIMDETVDHLQQESSSMHFKNVKEKEKEKENKSQTARVDVKSSTKTRWSTSARATEVSSNSVTTLGKHSMNQADLTADTKEYKRNRCDKVDTTASGPSASINSTMRQEGVERSQRQSDRKRPLEEGQESPHIKKNKTSSRAKKTPAAPKPKSGALGDITNVMSRASAVKPERTGQRNERVTKLVEALGAKTVSDIAKHRNEEESAQRVRVQKRRKPANPVDDKDQTEEEEDDKKKRQKKEEPRGKAGKEKADKGKSARDLENLQEKEKKEKAKALEPEDKNSKDEARLKRLRAFMMLNIPNHSVYGIHNVQHPEKPTVRAKRDNEADKKASTPATKPFTLDDILQKAITYNKGLDRQ